MDSNSVEILDVEMVVEEATEMGIQLIKAILSRKPYEIVKSLIDAGAPLWFQDDEGTSALHAAAYTENARLTRYLIEQGAVWNAGMTSSFTV